MCSSLGSVQLRSCIQTAVWMSDSRMDAIFAASLPPHYRALHVVPIICKVFIFIVRSLVLERYWLIKQVTTLSGLLAGALSLTE